MSMKCLLKLPVTLYNFKFTPVSSLKWKKKAKCEKEMYWTRIQVLRLAAVGSSVGILFCFFVFFYGICIFHHEIKDILDCLVPSNDISEMIVIQLFTPEPLSNTQSKEGKTPKSVLPGPIPSAVILIASMIRGSEMLFVSTSSARQ